MNPVIRVNAILAEVTGRFTVKKEKMNSIIRINDRSPGLVVIENTFHFDLLGFKCDVNFFQGEAVKFYDNNQTLRSRSRFLGVGNKTEEKLKNQSDLQIQQIFLKNFTIYLPINMGIDRNDETLTNGLLNRLFTKRIEQSRNRD